MAQDRIYSEEEIGRVLKRAAEIQGKQPRSAGYGLSLSEMQDLASEAGIDPSLVLAAVQEITAEKSLQKRSWWGGPMTSTLIRSVEGRISDLTWEDMLTNLRRRIKSTGTSERRGSTRQWTATTSSGGKCHLIATYRDGRTELELLHGNDGWGVPGTILPLIGAMIALPIVFEAMNLSGLPAFLAWAAIAAVLLFTGRSLNVSIGKWQNGLSEELMSELTGIATRASSRRREKKAEAASVLPTGKAKQSGPYLQVPDDEYSSSSAEATRERERG